MKTQALIIVVLVSMQFMVGCKGGKHKEFAGAVVPLEQSSPSKNVSDQVIITYDENIKPIILTSCLPCHGSGSAVGDWTDYQQVYAKRDVIKKRVFKDKDMPKGKDLDESSRKLIADWIESGAKKTSEIAAQSPSKEEPNFSTPSNPTNPPVMVEAPSVEKKLTFTDTIQPMVKEKCSMCHSDSSGLPNWLNYDVVISKKEILYERVVVKKDMPLGFTMTDAEREIFKRWIDEGLKYDTSNQPNPMSR